MDSTEENSIIDMGKWNMMAQKFKRIDFNSGKFEAKNTTYYLGTQMTASRYCDYAILQREMTFGMSLTELYDSIKNIKELLNKMRLADCCVYTDKIMNHAANLKQKEPTILKMCTLFINTENEDVAKWDNDLCMKKLNDWKAENIDVQDFFTIAFNLVPTFINVYNSFTQAITEGMEPGQLILNAIAATTNKTTYSA